MENRIRIGEEKWDTGFNGQKGDEMQDTGEEDSKERKKEKTLQTRNVKVTSKR